MRRNIKNEFITAKERTKCSNSCEPNSVYKKNKNVCRLNMNNEEEGTPRI